MKTKKLISLPNEIFAIEQGKPYVTNKVGMSGAEVRVYDDFVLKIQPHTELSINEAAFMRYLKGKVLAPDVLAYVTQDGWDYLLMSKLKGEMLFADKFLSNQALLIEKGMEVLSSLWKLPVQSCPCDMTLERRLRLAQYNVEHDNVDLENINPKLLGAKGRFKTPEQLLQWLIINKPSEELTVSHGDFCLPNIIVCGNKVGIIDFPFGGIADKYSDIALFYRSTKSNLAGKYGGKVYGEPDEKLFSDILGITPNFDKIEYYILLNELF